MRDMLFNLAYFYDRNFLGNKDFMHIPDITNIADNVMHFPMMLATQKDINGTEEILGATTVKMEKNNSISDNPYFPTMNENVFSITGILSKCNATDCNGNKIREIGKKLYKTAIKGAYEINKNEKIRLILEIDCRNDKSLYSVNKAIRELQLEGINVQIFINGYYEKTDTTNKLLEAPTFVLEIDLGNNKKISHSPIEFNYLDCRSTTLNKDLLSVIRSKTKEYRRYINLQNETAIIYHSIKPVDALNVRIEAFDTALGNDRKPVLQNLQVEVTSKSIV